jgi:uncharacterized coiled-coil protein SlyX
MSGLDAYRRRIGELAIQLADRDAAIEGASARIADLEKSIEQLAAERDAALKGAKPRARKKKG